MAFSDSHCEGDGEFVLACRKSGKLSTVYKLLKEGVDVNAVDWYGRTPLHYAAEHEGWLDLIKELMESHNSDPVARDNHNRTPLHYACRSGRLEVAKLLIETYKCDPQDRDMELNTPLHFACQTGQVRVVTLLLEIYNCDPNCVNKDGLTPLQKTLPYNTDTIRELVQHGANPNVFHSVSECGTLLHMACQGRELDRVKFLLGLEMCDPNVKNKSGLTPLQLIPPHNIELTRELIHHGADPNVVDNDGNTPLHMACELGDVAGVKSLLESEDCDPNIKNEAGLTPLQVTPVYNTETIIRYLVQHGADPDVQFKYGNTLLHKIVIETRNFLCRAPDRTVIRELISCGAKPNMVNNDGDTPLHIACQVGELDMVGYLLESEIFDPNIKNEAGLTPLQVTPPKCTDTIEQLIRHGAVVDGYYGGTLLHNIICQRPVCYRLIGELIQHGANPSVVNSDGDTPLHVACKDGRLDTMKCLLNSNKCHLNVKNNAGMTPLQVTFLHVCSMTSDMIKELIRHGANPNVVDNDGNTPLHLACKDGELMSVKYLLESRSIEDPNVKNNAGLTPLQVTPVYFTNIIKQLIQHGANIGIYGNSLLYKVICQRAICYWLILELLQCGVDPNVVNNDGDTPLHIACRDGELEIVEHILELKNCDPNIKNEAGLTPLQVTPPKCTDTIQQLIRHGAVVDGYYGGTLLHNIICQKPVCYRLIGELIQHGANPCVVNNDGDTPLHIACRVGELQMVECLLECENCDANTKNGDGLTPLQVTPPYYAEVFAKLVQHGANPNVFHIAGDGGTLLHMACRHGRLDRVKFLLGLETCDPNVKNKSGLTPLQLISPANTELTREIFRHGANPNVVDNDGNTPLHLACHTAAYTQYVSELIQHGANINVINNDGDTPLHLACKAGVLRRIKYLLDLKDCVVNIKNKAGLTPLQVAPLSCTVILEMLIEYGANPKVVDSDGNTMLHRACQDGELDFIKYLLSEVKCDPNSENAVGLTPIDVLELSSVDIIRELIRHGANPKHVYKTHGKVLQTKVPLQPPVKVFIVGNPSTGKSTLTASLKNESKLFGRFFQVSGVDEKTAGIDPHEFQSKKYGSVTFYDFAGQRSYYSSHAAVLRNTIQSSPPVFIIVVELLQGEDEIAKNVMFWVSFLNHQQFSSENKSHVVIVGSHADVITTRGERAEEKMARVIESLPPMNDFHVAGTIPMDCRYSTSDGMNRLQKCLKESCAALRVPVSISFNAHCFFIYLLDKFKTSTATTLRDIQRIVTSDTSSSAKEFIPDSLWALCNICDELNDRGHILYLKDQSVTENSWVILNKAALLSEVTGTIFAPADFKQHCILASSTGVVPLSNISSHFPDHNIEMLIAFLYHLEYCREITDPEARSLIIEHHQLSSIDVPETEHSDTELYFLFPGLIRLDAPEKVWEPRPQYTHYFGWKLECQSGKFFTTRLLQVLILRLAFSYVLAPDPTDVQTMVPSFQRKCSIWKSGIFWGDRCGVEVLVEMVPTNDGVILLIRCRDSNLENLLQLRSNLIQKILGASIELCSRINTVEFFADPSNCAKYPMKAMTTFGLREVANAVIGEVPDPAVVSSTGSAFPLKNLLIFEPYVGLGESILQDMFDSTPDDIVSDAFLSRMAERLTKSRDILFALFKPNPTLLAERISKCLVAGPCQEVLFVLQIWRDGCNGTYSMLREKLDQFSIFAGRNPLILAGINESRKKKNGSMPNESPPTVYLQDPGDESQSEPEVVKLLPNPPKGFKPTLQQLQVLEGCGGKRVRVMDSVAAEWEELAIALGFEPSDIDRLKRDYIRDAKGACRQALTMWLNGESSHKDQPLTWATLVQCLIDAGFVDLADDLNEVLGDDVGYSTTDQQQ